MISRIGLLAPIAASALLVAIGGAGARAAALPPGTAVGACVERHVGSATVAWAAVAARPTTAFRLPGGRKISRFGLRNANGARTVFGVVGERRGAGCRVPWLHVELPLRPNGVTGWVRARDVYRDRVRTRIVVDLSERRVWLYDKGRLVLTSRAAIGSHATPTPVGRFYVNQRLVPADRRGPFGPGAVGISAFSPVLTGWTQGGPIAIHGTNEPWSIGHAVSNGCIRLPNEVLRRLFGLALAGTPVAIRR